MQAGAQADVLAQTPTGLMLGTGSRVVSTEKIHRQGNMVSTENALDLAISGDGFFAIQPGRWNYRLYDETALLSVQTWELNHSIRPDNNPRHKPSPASY